MSCQSSFRQIVPPCRALLTHQGIRRDWDTELGGTELGGTEPGTDLSPGALAPGVSVALLARSQLGEQMPKG